MSEPFTGEHPTASLPRRRRLRALAAAGVVAVLLLAGTYYRLTTFWDRELAEAVADAKRDLPGWRLADLEAARQVIPDEENSSPLVARVRTLSPRPWPVWMLDPPAGTPDVVALEDREAFSRRLDELPPNARLDAEQVRVLRAELTRAACAVGLARSFLDHPRGRHPITYSKDGLSTGLNLTQDTRWVAVVLDPDVTLRAHEGDFAGALESCHAIVNANRAVGDEPFLISALVRIAVRRIAVLKTERVLAQGEPPPDALSALQRVLEEEDEVPLLLQGARGDRAAIDTFLEAVRRGDVSRRNLTGLVGWANGQKGGFIQDVKVQASSLALAHCQAECLRFMNRFVDIARRPPEEWREPMRELGKDVKRGLPLTRLLCEVPMQKVTLAALRSHADLRCGAALLAVERYRQARGRWPESLADLVPAYLTKVPTDPFDGQPLRFTRLADGVAVYSVSADGNDDGGNLSLKFLEEGTDWGLRLWDAAARGGPGT